MSMPISELAAIALFFISLYGLIVGRRVMQSIIALSMMETAAVVFIVGIGFSAGDGPPIGPELTAVPVADPLPQALVITAIIIGLAVKAVGVVMFISLSRESKATDWATLNSKGMD